MSLARQNFSSDLEAAINKQINIELYASYVYLSMSAYFDRDDVALANIAKFMKEQSNEEREHAEGLIKIQNIRGGRVVFQAVNKPEKDEWGTALEAFQAALTIEKANNQALLILHEIADKSNDAQIASFLEDKYLQNQVESISKMAKFVANLKRVGSGLGEYLFNRLWRMEVTERGDRRPLVCSDILAVRS